VAVAGSPATMVEPDLLAAKPGKPRLAGRRSARSAL
jgi:hypothetical protein